MKVEQRTVKGIPVLDVSGDVDLSTSPDLRRRLLETLGPASSRLVVNLEDVSYMDSSGLATLVEAFQSARGHHGNLALCCLSQRLRRIFELARLDSVFPIHEVESDALAFLAEEPGG